MADLTLRLVKGSPLTNAEVDGNFSALNSDISTINQSLDDISGLFDGGDITVDTIAINKAVTQTVDIVGTVSSSSYNIDLSEATVYDITLGNDVVFTFTNPPTSGQLTNCSLILRQDGIGSRTATFTDAIYTDGNAPTLTTTPGAVDMLSFFTYDNGGSYFGSFIMADVK